MTKDRQTPLINHDEALQVPVDLTG